ncbi:flagellin [Haloarcula onubensis]|uniref:Flagellin n=1 Tax=Haloarcula onubensis TaxID=2950539 RepID=A0ABU2FMM2_9EURY|nr:flagellin [Halomicroarcula sp. S3CR25-11]MDS0281993.1 flagellin [Halomicroarcula sp. S3CR25-11]
MGFSVSGSAALIFVAAFIGFGMFYSAAANSTELVNDAREDRSDRQLERTNTEIDVTDVTYNAIAQYVNLTVENTGATELTVSDVDVLVDNSYQTGYRTAVEGDTATDLWLPGETLTINVTVGGTPSRVKLVTGPGVAATEVV